MQTGPQGRVATAALVLLALGGQLRAQPPAAPVSESVSENSVSETRVSQNLAPETSTLENQRRGSRFLSANQLRLAPGARSRAGFEKPASGTKVSHELRRLHREYAEHLASGRAFRRVGAFTTAGPLRVHQERVAIDAVAAGETEDLRAALEALGLEHTATWGRLVGGLLPVSAIDELQRLPSLHFVRAAMAATNAGSVTSQGDVATSADDARSTFAIDGSGVTVGLISDSFDCNLDQTAVDQASGDLPAEVEILDEYVAVDPEEPFPFCGGGFLTDEGRALGQIVHDLAPGASLVFHTGFISEADFADGIVQLVEEGAADLIVDDVFYYAEPFFQDGVITQAIDEVVAAGVPYFTAAGNHGRDSYESPFDPSGMTVTGNGEAHDFDPGPGVDLFQEISTEYLSLLTMTLQWDSPFFSISGSPGSAHDLDIYIYDQDETTMLASSDDLNVGGDPVEVLSFFNGYPGETFNIVIEGGPAGGSVPGLIKYVVWSGTGGIGEGSILEWQTNSGTVVGHSNAAGALSVGAAAWFETPEFGQDPALVESFSSSGGTPILFDPMGGPTDEARAKPNVVCPNDVNTTFFGSDIPEDLDSDPNFPGTSAAAPHAAAIAALMIQAFVEAIFGGAGGALQATGLLAWTPQDLYDAIEATALDMGPPGFDDDTGYGFCVADQATETFLDNLDNVPLLFRDDLETGDLCRWGLVVGGACL